MVPMLLPAAPQAKQGGGLPGRGGGWRRRWYEARAKAERGGQNHLDQWMFLNPKPQTYEEMRDWVEQNVPI